MQRTTYYAGTTSPATVNPATRFVTVLVRMPHMSRYNRPTVMRLTYGATFPVAVGDDVLCPPTRMHKDWTRGSIVALDPSGYAGKVKYLAPLSRKRRK